MPRSQIVYRPLVETGRGWCVVHPGYAAGFARLGITTAAGFLDLSGEVVGGHPDRHVVRVCLPGFPAAFYLKRQHVVPFGERLRNWWAGFGWSARCTREAVILEQLAAGGLPAPRWAAYGEDGTGRAFLLVEEWDGHDLRRWLADTRSSPTDRRRVLTRLGRSLARVHAAGITTPALSAKHVLVSPDGREVAFLDWASAGRWRRVGRAERLRALAVLHASVADDLATPRERLRVLWTALAPARGAGVIVGRFSALARQVEALAARFRDRRSLRDQWQCGVADRPQRLVWLAGEAVCAVPEAVAAWPQDPISPPFYGGRPGTFDVQFAGRPAVLVRGRSWAPLGRLLARLKGRPWRSPGATLGRVLFHLERYGIPAPRLLAFGQRLVGWAGAEWFALHTPPAEPLPINPDERTCEHLGRLLRRLHDAGCRLDPVSLSAFGGSGPDVSVRTVSAVRLARVSAAVRRRERDQLAAWLPASVRAAFDAGYDQMTRERHRAARAARAVPVEG